MQEGVWPRCYSESISWGQESETRGSYWPPVEFEGGTAGVRGRGVTEMVDWNWLAAERRRRTEELVVVRCVCVLNSFAP